MSGLPLEGVTVVALEQAVAGPFATRQLADLGARVIKVERAGGDFAREYDEAVMGLSSYFVWLNRSKESIVLDLKSAHGHRVLGALLERADVLVQNLAPGAVERLGFGPGPALKLNPRLIHVSISGYGAQGPYRDRKAYDLLVQCEAGLLSVTGSDDEPAKVGISIADIAAGMYAYSGILTALLNRGRVDEGQVIEVSMLEALGEWMSHPALAARHSGRSQGRTGSHHATIAPYGPFACSDGTVFLAVQNEREWRNLCSRLLHRPELADDERFRTNVTRVANLAELHELIQGALASRTLARVERLLDESGIAYARMRDLESFVDHPQLTARQRWRPVGSPVAELDMLIPPVTTSSWTHRMDPIPRLGEHTDRVLAELGIDRPPSAEGP